MYTRYLTIIMMLTFIRVNSLTMNKYFKVKTIDKSLSWKPSNFEEYKSYLEYQDSRQVKEQSIKCYDKLHNEYKLLKYIKNSYKHSK